MDIQKTNLRDCCIIKPKIFDDFRGYFFESFNSKIFKEKTGLLINFVQDNEVFSNRGVLRGLHFQKEKFAQAKLVRVIKGKVLDVAVDLRTDSATFGKSFSTVLSGKNKKQLFIPRGFAHGYSVLENSTIVVYKCDNYYNPEAEEGIIYNDPGLKIDWMLSEEEIQLSKKDRNFQNL